MSKTNRMAGFLNKQGKTVIPFVYKRAKDFSEGLAAVKTSQKWGFVDKEGNISLVKNIDKVVFDGSENWILDTITSNTNIRQFHLFLNDKNVLYDAMSNNIFVMSDYFKGVVWDSSWLKNNTITPYTDGVNKGFRLYSEKFEDVNALKTWLSTNNVTVYYLLATPEVIPLGTLSELITTEEGINTFFINGNLETTLEVLYARDSEKYLQQYIDDKLATLSQAVMEEG